MKQATLGAFFKKPQSNNASSSRPENASLQVSTRPVASAPPPAQPKRKASATDDDDDEPAPFVPQPHAAKARTSAPVGEAVPHAQERSETQDDEQAQAVSSRGRKLGKRKVIIDDSSEEDEDAGTVHRRTSSSASRSTTGASSVTSAPPARRKKPRYAGDSDDDEFMFDEASTGASAALGSEDDDLSEMDIDTAETSLTSSASRARTKGKNSAKAGASARARPQMPQKASSGGGKALTKAQQAKERGKADAEERTVPWRFLRDVKDADRNPKGSPNYDPRTLHIAKEDWAQMTPFETQFWEIKKNHFDTVLFFQKGKFSELYEDDAFIGHQEFDLKITRRVKMSMVGVPSTSLEFWISKFLAKGYRVGRVDQSETALGAEMRSKGTLGSKDKGPAQKQKNGKEIVRRELKSVVTSGTITDGAMLTDDGAQCLIVLKESVNGANGAPTYGVVMLDATTAEFTLSHFSDDACRTKLETIVRQTQPKEMLFEKGQLSAETMRLLKSCAPFECVWTGLKPSTEFVSDARARSEIEKLLGDDVPQTVRSFFDRPETMEALGALWWYLTQLNLSELFTTRNFTTYDPLRRGQALLLDGQTLAHIEVLANSHGTEEGTLLRLLDRTVTPFGKRLFRQWLTAPLQDIHAINERLDAVEDLMNHPDFEKELTSLAKGMPDLERLISRIHAGSVTVKNFRLVLKSFRRVHDSCRRFSDLSADFKGRIVGDLLQRAPAIDGALKELEGDFTGDGSELVPHEGRDALYDAAIGEMREAEDALDQELEWASGLLKCSCEFRDIGIKDIRQIQVSAKIKVPKDWTKMSSTKEYNRYYTPKLIKLVRALKEAREKETHAKEEFHLRVFEKFDASYHALWLPTVKLISKLDCLVSLAKSSAALGDDACRPTFVNSPSASIDFCELRHPCLVANLATEDFIPNDVSVGNDDPRTILLSGPNMAGKSTLLRATCVGVICAQLGCYVAAKTATLAPVDRIQTRMGASDSIFTHSSTFMVEMNDARKTLMESTPRSLVVLDELGRGTSTHDGHAIAFSVLHALATHVQCLTLFATHYSLVADFANHPNVAPMFMSTSLEEGRLCFLYKLKKGTAPRSFGPMVARLAGVASNICDRATQVSEEFERATRARHQATRGQESLSLCLQADAAWLIHQSASGGRLRAFPSADRAMAMASMRRLAMAM